MLEEELKTHPQRGVNVIPGELKILKEERGMKGDVFSTSHLKEYLEADRIRLKRAYSICQTLKVDILDVVDAEQFFRPLDERLDQAATGSRGCHFRVDMEKLKKLQSKYTRDEHFQRAMRNIKKDGEATA